jgi:hypothetical protein
MNRTTRNISYYTALLLELLLVWIITVEDLITRVAITVYSNHNQQHKFQDHPCKEIKTRLEQYINREKSI